VEMLSFSLYVVSCDFALVSVEIVQLLIKKEKGLKLSQPN